MSKFFNLTLDSLKNLSNKINESINSIEPIDFSDFEKQMKVFTEETIPSKISQIKKQFNEVVERTDDSYKVFVSYDRNLDTIDSKIEESDGQCYFSAIVNKNADNSDGSTNTNQVRVLIQPNIYDVNNILTTYDAEKHFMIFTFKKK